MAVAQPSIEIDQRTLGEVRELLVGMEKMVPRVIRRAIKRTTSQLRTKMIKVGAKAFGIKQKTIRERVWRNVARTAFIGKVRAGKIGWPLSAFSPRKTRKGITIKIFGRRQVAEGAFMATMPTGHEGVFVRKGRQSLPIVEARAKSLTLMLEEEGLTPLLVTFARRVFNAELLDAADWYADRAAKRDPQLAYRREQASASRSGFNTYGTPRASAE